MQFAWIDTVAFEIGAPGFHMALIGVAQFQAAQIRINQNRALAVSVRTQPFFMAA